MVELHRIKVLTDAGVPLRVRGLVDAEQEAFREAAAQIDAELRARIAELEATRGHSTGSPFGVSRSFRRR